MEDIKHEKRGSREGGRGADDRQSDEGADHPVVRDDRFIQTCRQTGRWTEKNRRTATTPTELRRRENERFHLSNSSASIYVLRMKY